MAASEPAELLLAQIWHAQWLTDALALGDGRPLRVVYRGVWTHGLGPDFRGAYLDLGGALREGDVEVHRRASDWVRHGHHLDPAYNTTILHTVLDDDLGQPVRRQDGAAVSTLCLRDALPGPLDAFPSDASLRPLGAIGFAHCAPQVAASDPGALVALWEEAGDRRMAGKAEAVAARLAEAPPAQVLYALLLDALGYTRNRAPMQALAAALPYDHLDARLDGHASSERFARAAALLLGAGGFLPLTPRERELAGLEPEPAARIEAAWLELGAPWRDLGLSPTSWTLARVRPAAHPLRRLLALATLLAHSGDGLLGAMDRYVESTDAEGGLLAWLTGDNPYLGAAHAHEIIVNVVVPFALAYGEATGRDGLLERAQTLWRELRAGAGNSEVRRTVEQICGPHRVPVRSARAEQGLLHLRRTGCAQLRCFECPIAHLALHHEQPGAP